MKPYGVPRVLDVEFPDKLDITIYGLSPGRYLEKRKSKTKRYFRRVWKKRYRKHQKRELNKIIKENNDTKRRNI